MHKQEKNRNISRNRLVLTKTDLEAVEKASWFEIFWFEFLFIKYVSLLYIC